MNKIIVLGDIHGKTDWIDILDKERFDPDHNDKVIFLGDYVSTHFDISETTQINNLKDILTFKEKYSDSVILLRGNHDMQHLGYYWAECSGLFPGVLNYLSDPKNKGRFLKDTQWIYIKDKYLFSHAGISKTWLNSTGETIDNINNLNPSEIFGFTPDHYGDYSGYSKTQPCTWIRPQTLIEDKIDGYIQFVGHTPVKKIFSWNKVWLCDCLDNKQYIIINGKSVIINKYE